MHPPPAVLGRDQPVFGLSDEFEQGLVHVLGVSPPDIVWSALDLDELNVADQVGQPSSRGIDRQDAVLGALDDEQRYVDLRQVGAKVRQPDTPASVA